METNKNAYPYAWLLPDTSESPIPNIERIVYAAQTGIAEIFNALKMSFGSLAIVNINMSTMPFLGSKIIFQMLYSMYIGALYSGYINEVATKTITLNKASIQGNSLKLFILENNDQNKKNSTRRLQIILAKAVVVINDNIG